MSDMQPDNHEAPDQTCPVKPGDWVVSKFNSRHLGKVKAVHPANSYDPKFLFDLVIYSTEGDKVGRESPAMGGPRSFEPCLDYADWKRIEAPDFPLSLKWVPQDDGSTVADFAHSLLPDRKWTKPERRAIASKKIRSDYDPASEAASRRMAAQELRDTGRKLGLKELAERADVLEAEAERILPRGR